MLVSVFVCELLHLSVVARLAVQLPAQSVDVLEAFESSGGTLLGTLEVVDPHLVFHEFVFQRRLKRWPVPALLSAVC